MGFEWSFKEATPGDRARESQVEKFFKSDAVKDRANAVIREGIQNSLDAAVDNGSIHIRVFIGTWSPGDTEERLLTYEAGLRTHLTAETVAKSISELPSADQEFRYLVFEDFGTTGLRGDPGEWWPEEDGRAGAFFKYFRAEGISGKHDGARGRHGVGRLVFMFASRIRAMLGLTRRKESSSMSEEMVMGTTVLRNHWQDGKPFLPDGWFGTPDDDVPGLILPIRDQGFIERFKSDFNISRRQEDGLSVVVPWLSDEVTYEAVVKAVLSEYYYPVLEGSLTVEVVDQGSSVTINAESIETVVAEMDSEFVSRQLPLLTLAKEALAADSWLSAEEIDDGAPRWSKGVISEELAEQISSALQEGRSLFLRVPVKVRPKSKIGVVSEFKIALQRDPEIGESQINFVREGILISDVRPRRTTGVRALVIIEHGPLGEFLGDSENPSHTEWQKDVVKDLYTYAPGLVDFVVQSVPGLLSELSKQQQKADTTLLLDLFSLPADEGKSRKQKEQSADGGDETEPPKVDVVSRPRSYEVLRSGSGFLVRKGSPEARRPSLLSIRAAYDVRRGNPFKKYQVSDFEFGKGGVELVAKGCAVVHSGMNSALVRVLEDDFEFAVTGFDVARRDILVDVKIPNAAATAGSDGDI